MYFYRYFYLGKSRDIFANIFDSGNETIDDIRKMLFEKKLSTKTYNEEYLHNRIKTEVQMREEFIKKGGVVCIKHPHYLTLGKNDRWFYGLKRVYGSIAIPFSEIDLSKVSFTFGDSFPTYLDEFNDGKEYRKHVYTFNEIKDLINKYGWPQKKNPFEKDGPENYIEAQVWYDEPFIAYRNLLLENGDINEANVDTFIKGMLLANKRIISDTKQLSLNAFLNKGIRKELLIWYKELLKSINPNMFCSDDIHGLVHALKCSFYAFVISHLKSLSYDDSRLLILSSLFHDIGRNYNEGGLDHASLSAKYLNPSYYPNDQMFEHSKVMVALHSKRIEELDDDLLITLKEIDSLDYMRFGLGVFNPKLLRSIEAKSLIRLTLELNIRMYLNPNYIYSLLEKIG